jgi:hypothetical protein
MGDNNFDGDGGGVDGDGYRGNSPSQMGARTDTSIPRTSSATAAVLRNFSGRNADLFRVFASEALYRRRGDVRGHQVVAQPRVVPRHQVVWPPPGPPPSLLWTPSRVEKIGTLGFVSSNSENIFCVTFLKHKNNRKQGTDTVASH